MLILKTSSNQFEIDFTGLPYFYFYILFCYKYFIYIIIIFPKWRFFFNADHYKTFFLICDLKRKKKNYDSFKNE